MIISRWQFLSRSALAILARWQLIIIPLAISGIACASPGWASTQAPAASPVPIQTRTEAPLELTPTASPIPAAKTGIVSALRALNVRKGSSERTESLGVLLAGARVALTGRCTPAGWAQIRYKLEGKTVLAWVNGRYVSGDRCKEEK